MKGRNSAKILATVAAVFFLLAAVLRLMAGNDGDGWLIGLLFVASAGWAGLAIFGLRSHGRKVS